MKVAVSREENFNAAHRLYNPAWSDERNDAVFGKCNNPNFHGHNYRLIVTVKGETDPETGYVIDLKTLSDLIQTHVLRSFDHKNLNFGYSLVSQPEPDSGKHRRCHLEHLAEASRQPTRSNRKTL